MGGCTSITKSGKQCSFSRVYGDKCHLHNPDKPKVKKEIPNEERCTFILKNGKRCEHRKYISAETCLKHASILPKEENVMYNPKILDIFDSNTLPRRSEIGLIEYNCGGFSSLRGIPKEKRDSFSRIEIPLKTNTYTDLEYTDPSSHNFKVRNRYYIYSRPSFQYFITVGENRNTRRKELVVYDRRKSNFNVRNCEMVVLLPVEFDSDYDRMIFLSEDPQNEKFLLGVERCGVICEKIKVDVFDKRVEVSVPSISSYYFSRNEILTSATFQDYIFIIKKSPEDKNRSIVEQSFIDSGMKLCRYHCKKISSMKQLSFGIAPALRNKNLELKRNPKICVESGKDRQNFEIVVFDNHHPIRRLNENRVLSLILKKMKVEEYLSFIVRKIVMVLSR